MKLDYVDIFYAHRHDPETPLEETAGALVTAVQSGKALYAGISKFPAEQTRQICAMLREARVPCLVHQLRYNMFNREPEAGVFAAIREEGLGCVAFSPLAQGMLTNRYLEGIPADSRAAGASVFLTEERVLHHGDRVRRLAAPGAGSRPEPGADGPGLGIEGAGRDHRPYRGQPPRPDQGLPGCVEEYAVFSGGTGRH